ncbi:unnamed protein product [Prunus armeniaca]|uniref:Uncharacterized protein n=1 Tax=Prunus armeniaca TaxID=36596 RepID=A0A6J5US94_PRUAR|nr:unnamed protein product [Prunus armeniaca]
MAPVSLHWNDDTPENVVLLPCLKSMTWAMENKNSAPGNIVAVINLKVSSIVDKADDGLHLISELQVVFVLVFVGANDDLHLISELQVPKSFNSPYTFCFESIVAISHLLSSKVNTGSSPSS